MKKNKVYNLFSLILPISNLLFVGTSCNGNKQNNSIFLPSCKEASVEIIPEEKTDVTFYGFQYKNTLPEALTVQSDFKIEGSEVETTICDLSEQFHTFSVKVSFSKAKPITSLQSKFTFYVGEKEFEKFDDIFTINLLYSKIINPTNKTAVGQLQSGSTTLTFSDFSYEGNIVENKLRVENNFQMPSNATFESKIDDFNSQQKTFSVVVTVTGGYHMDDISGLFTFYYDDQKMENYEQEYFSITLTDPQWITNPISKQTTAIFNTSTSSSLITFEQFSFSGFYDKNELSVKTSFSQGSSTKELTANIVDFSTSNHTFNVSMELDNQVLGKWVGFISFFVGDDKIFTTEELSFIVYNAIPESCLNIEPITESGVTYNHLVSMNESMIESSYNALVIPSTVNYIDAEAFKDKFIGTTNNIQFIYFGDALSLFGIGKHAFSGCANLIENLTLGESIKTIGENAFTGCSGITELTIPFNSQYELQIGNNAFSNCTSINDLFLWQNPYIPSWVTTENNNIFSGIDKTGNIYIYKQTLENDWERYLKNNAHLEGAWEYHYFI